MQYIKEHKLLFITLLAAGVVQLLAAIFDGPILAGLLLSAEAFILYLWLFVKGGEQALMPKDGLSGLRNTILFFVIAAILFTIPGVVYAVARYNGIELEWLRGVTNVTGGIQKIAAPMLLVLVFEYKVKSEDN